MGIPKLVLAVAVVLAVGMQRILPGVEFEKELSYMTDSHGASGVAHAFLELSEIAPEYDRYWKGALDWLISVAERDGEGRMAWVMSPSAPQGHKNRQLNIPSMCHIIRMFFAAYRRCGDERYRDAALSGVRTLLERFARKQPSEYGTSYAWSHTYWTGDRTPGLLAGHSHGLGNLADVFLDAYEAAPDERLKTDLQEALKGILINLRLRGNRSDKDGLAMIAWPALNNPKVVETGYCYGQAGLIVPLLRLAEALPELRLSDGTTALSLANENLRYLMSVARKAGDGFVWPYMRHEPATKNVGYGSGTGGIGWAFLRGAQVNRKTALDFAAGCMTYARGAAVYAIDLVLTYKGAGPLPSPGGEAGFGVCGGAGGMGYFLILYARDVGDKDPDLVKRINAAIEKTARLVIASTIEIDGTLACPDRVHFKRINIALDYGQTGVVLGLAIAGRYLKNPELIEAAKKVASYIVRQAVPEGGGYKFAQFRPIPQ